MRSPRFGTDGVRGIANEELTPELALALGRAAARVLGPGEYLLGRDTRRSGPMLAAALAAGLASEGARVVDLGVAPTPAVAHLAAERSAPGVVVSASHNPFPDNGVKVFAPGGVKLDPAREAAIEADLETLGSDPALDPHGRRRPVAGAVGTVVDGAPLLQAYEEHLVGSLDGRDLAGLRVVLDCANGAAARIAPRVVAALGAEVDVIEAEPDGTNINAGCGALHPGSLGRAVLSAGADLGLAFDGDADRLVAVDHAGATVDGDHLLALFALDLRSRSLLGPDAVVVTVMSNLGFHQAMRAAGIDVVQTPVGDRHVLDAIEARGLSLGGEQSGHIIFRRLATTGDGLLTGLQLADLLRRSGRPLTELAAGAMTRLPQRLANLAVDRPSALEAAAEVWQEVAAVESELAGSGRVLLRASGTEPVVRVMVEAPTDELAGELVSRLSQAVERALGRGAEAAPEGAMGPGRSLLPAPALETGQAVAE